MPYYPTLAENNSSVEAIDVFRGYNHNLRINDGEWFDCENLSLDSYPVMSSRKKRGIVATLSSPQGILAKDKLAYVDGATLYYNGAAVPGITLSTVATKCPKTLLSMGAYVLIWPDKVYYNTQDSTDYGSMENIKVIDTEAQGIDYSVCKIDGGAITATPSATAPVDPANGAYWLDTSATPHVLKVYSESQEKWTEVSTRYVKITSTDIGVGFSKYDGVVLSGCFAPSGIYDDEVIKEVDSFNKAQVIFERDDDYIVIGGSLSETVNQYNYGSVILSRTVPDMDYVTEAENRIWGCKYGLVDGKPINAIYACKLGDFKNWNCYQEISTDSYFVNCGTDGPFTGAITHAGYPVFFKENYLHKVYINAAGAHQVATAACNGVQKGSANSMCIINGKLYFKSRTDVLVFDGSLPVPFSDVFGGILYDSAAAGAFGNKYYISMRQTDTGNWHMFCYDTLKDMWTREDDTHAQDFASLDGDLYYIDALTKKIMCINGTKGTPESAVEWSATTGIIGFSYVNKKYISRFNLRMALGDGADMDIYIQYDSNGIWEHKGHLEGADLRTFTLPIRPRRCDHMRIKLEGTGEFKLYSLAKVLEIGSDYQ